MGKSQVPALRVERQRAQVGAKMLADGGGQGIGFLARQFNGAGVRQHDAIAHHPQMHRVGAQPVGVPGHAAIRLQGDRGERPVLLAGDAQRFAQGGLHALRPGRTERCRAPAAFAARAGADPAPPFPAGVRTGTDGG